MIRGLVIGKFDPVHAGHLALIRFASSQCHELVVSMSYTGNDSFPPEQRYAWLSLELSDVKNMELRMIKDDFDNPALPLPERTIIWADVIHKTYGQFDRIFSSEEYGDPFAASLDAEHIEFDRPRNQIPVSATAIKKNPFKYWEHIPVSVRPQFVKKICLYGPESTGKSTLSKKLAAHYQTEFVPEVARELITSNEFTVDDILRIGYAQTERVLEKTERSNKLLFCDTDVITTEIYSKHYLGVIPEELSYLEKKVKYDLYFFMDIDIPWVADGLRDLGERRQEMRDVFKNELDKRGISYIVVKGDYHEREEQVRRVIDATFFS